MRMSSPGGDDDGRADAELQHQRAQVGDGELVDVRARWRGVAAAPAGAERDQHAQAAAGEVGLGGARQAPEAVGRLHPDHRAPGRVAEGQHLDAAAVRHAQEALVRLGRRQRTARLGVGRHRLQQEHQEADELGLRLGPGLLQHRVQLRRAPCRRCGRWRRRCRRPCRRPRASARPSASAGVSAKALARKPAISGVHGSSLVTASTRGGPAPPRIGFRCTSTVRSSPVGRSCRMPSPPAATSPMRRANSVRSASPSGIAASEPPGLSPKTWPAASFAATTVPSSPKTIAAPSSPDKQVVDPAQLGRVQLLEDLQHAAHLLGEGRAGRVRQPPVPEPRALDLIVPDARSAHRAARD